ncbi:MAG: alpha/beta hydrolase family protein [Woeseiaceae bacterium]
MAIAFLNFSGRRVPAWLGAGIGVMMLCVPLPVIAEILVTERLDGSAIKLVIERPEHEAEIPAVLFIDGSGCQSANREGFQKFSRLPDSFGKSVAKVFVDKPGVNPDGIRGECNQAFLDYYTIQQRVLDHLRAIQHLRTHAPWWNGEIFLVGWSDGAMIGVSVSSYTPEVKKSVFLALGGGIPMTRQFEDFILCAPDRTETRETCIEDLRETYAGIRANPSSNKTWLGDANSYKAWATRLDAVEYHLIKDLRIPILIIHGENDRDSVPVEAARELIRMLENDGSVNFEYWEVPDAGHDIAINTEGQSDSVRNAMFNWLFGQDPGIGGPPSFGGAASE